MNSRKVQVITHPQGCNYSSLLISSDNPLGDKAGVHPCSLHFLRPHKCSPFDGYNEPIPTRGTPSAPISVKETVYNFLSRINKANVSPWPLNYRHEPHLAPAFPLARDGDRVSLFRHTPASFFWAHPIILKRPQELRYYLMSQVGSYALPIKRPHSIQSARYPALIPNFIAQNGLAPTLPQSLSNSPPPPPPIDDPLETSGSDEVQ